MEEKVFNKLVRDRIPEKIKIMEKYLIQEY